MAHDRKSSRSFIKSTGRRSLACWLVAAMQASLIAACGDEPERETRAQVEPAPPVAADAGQPVAEHATRPADPHATPDAALPAAADAGSTANADASAANPGAAPPDTVAGPTTVAAAPRRRATVAQPVPEGAEARVLEYELRRQRVFVLAPRSGLSAGPVDVLVYFHGLHGYYWREDYRNAIRATELAVAIGEAGGRLIAVLPEARKGDADRARAWQRVVAAKGGFSKLVESALAHTAKELGLAGLEPRRIGVAAHSGGGAMIGRAVGERGGPASRLVTDVTLLDAGYAYSASWKALRDWLFTDPPGKNLRILWGGGDKAGYAVSFFSRKNSGKWCSLLKTYRGLERFAQKRGFSMTPEELPTLFELAGEPLQVVEVTRSRRDPSRLQVSIGALRGKGHYRLRDIGLEGCADSIGAGAAGLLPAGPAERD